MEFPSTNPFFGTSSRKSAIRLLDSRPNSEFKDIESGYKSVIDIRVFPKRGVIILIFPSTKDHVKLEYSLKNSSKFDFNEGNNQLYAEFSDGRLFTVEFQKSAHGRLDFRYYRKYLQSYEERFLKQNTEEEEEGEEERDIVEDFLCPFLRGYKGPSKTRKKNGKISPSLKRGSGNVFENLEFFKVPCSEWTNEHKREWMKYIPYQYKEEDKHDKKENETRKIRKISLYEHIKSIGKETTIKRIFLEDLNDQSKKSLSVEELYSEAKRKGSNFQQEFQGMDDLLEVFRLECGLIMSNGGRFNIRYHNILEKMLGCLSDQTKLDRLLEIRTLLLCRLRQYWDAHECMNYIMYLLLFHEKMDEEEYFVDIKNSRIDEKVWRRRMEEFHREKGIKLDTLLYSAWKKEKRFDLARRMGEKADMVEKQKLALCEIEEERGSLKEEIEKLYVEQCNCSKEMIEAMSEVKQVSKEDKKEIIKRTKVVLDQIDNTKKKLKDLEEGEKKLKKERKECEDDLEVLKAQESSFDVDVNNSVFEFYTDERNEKLKKAFQDKIRKSSDGEICQLTVKLVISMRRPTEEFNFDGNARRMAEYIRMWDNFIQVIGQGLGNQKMNELVMGNSFSLGMVHANILFSNISLHWGRSGLIDIRKLCGEDIYEEVIALDTDCTLFFSPKFLIDDVAKLSSFVVRANAMMEYQDFELGRNMRIDRVHLKNSLVPVKMNCQEISLMILKEFGTNFLTTNNRFREKDFYPEVYKYVFKYLWGHITSILKDHEKGSKETLRKKVQETRKIEIPPGLWKVLKQNPTFNHLFLHNVPEETKKKTKDMKVILRNHRRVDEFLMCCEGVCDNDFEVSYPGVYRLLKGFDRAFWILEEKKWRNIKDWKILEEEYVREWGSCRFCSAENKIMLGKMFEEARRSGRRNVDNSSLDDRDEKKREEEDEGEEEEEI